jgi:hypothetical protein
MLKNIKVLIACLVFVQVALHHHFVICISSRQSIRIESSYQTHCSKGEQHSHFDARDTAGSFTADDCATCIDQPLTLGLFTKNKSFTSRNNTSLFNLITLIPASIITQTPAGTSPRFAPSPHPAYDPDVIVLRV